MVQTNLKARLDMLEFILEEFPKEIRLREDFRCTLRPLESGDEPSFHEFFLAVPEQERMFIKHRVTEPEVIREWCQHIDYERNLPMLALHEGRVIGDATLHQQLGGWKRHVGRVSVLIHPAYRGRGLAKLLVHEIVEIARQIGVERVEAEFIGSQETAMRMFGMLGFEHLVRLHEHVKDMEAHAHDYVLMGLDLETDEEFAGRG